MRTRRRTRRNWPGSWSSRAREHARNAYNMLFQPEALVQERWQGPEAGIRGRRPDQGEMKMKKYNIGIVVSEFNFDITR